jgi:hypothetical protein
MWPSLVGCEQEYSSEGGTSTLFAKKPVSYLGPADANGIGQVSVLDIPE